VRLHFLGAAGNVTGSRYLVEANGKRILIDYGMFQERDYLERNWMRLEAPPETVDALLLTHAHIDHSGLIPKLANDGFAGLVFATPGSVDLAEILLLDSAHIQEEDARFKKARHRVEKRTDKRPDVLYTETDVWKCLSRFRSVPYDRPIEVADGVRATWFDAGHMLGSAHIRLEIEEGGRTTTVVFSGDIGQSENPILRNPTRLDHADVVVVESTYGNRCHETRENALDALAETVNDVVSRRGNLIVPSFAVGRTQELIFFLKRLLADARIPELPTFVDSPMAIRATEVFHRHPEAWNDAFANRVYAGEDPLGFQKLHFTRESDESRAIALYPPSAVIISASGMCNAGRIKHHLANNIGDPKSTILFIGYQATGTLGRAIVDGENPVRILGSLREVRAKIASISGFSAHADATELDAWMASFGESPRHVFITHGEADAGQAFRSRLEGRLACPVRVPKMGDVFDDA
jgi:metallo-beta-lactamase family protein